MSVGTIRLDELVPSRYDRLVAAEPNPDGTATLFQRTADDSVSQIEVEFKPWLLTAGRSLVESVPGVAGVEPLCGRGVHTARAWFADLAAYYDGVKHLKSSTGYPPSSPLAPYRALTDLTQQLLSLLPARLFRAMLFPELRRLQLDIETLTSPGYDFPNAGREGDAIVLIALSDSTGWEHCLSGPEMAEAEMLRQMAELIRERDPDVIEGHNFFGFDLPYIEERCKRHRVKLALGRDGSRVRSRSSRFTAGERTSTYRRYDIYGRHVVDTLHLVQLYDVAHRDLDSYGLKATARYFGVAAPDRTYVEGAEISDVYRDDPARLRAYAMDDVRETQAISGLLSPSFFYQAQLIPFSFQNCVTRGNASRIDALLVASYLTAGQSLPRPQAGRPFQGGLTDSLRSGVFESVWHVDVRSLYPSIIISNNMGPRSDALGLFNTFLRELRRFRLAAKDASRSGATAERDHLEALQSSFKILINSFYGYTGWAQGTFNDFDVAAAVTARGREILQSMVDFLSGDGAAVIEIDTDGIYFVPPPAVTDTHVMQSRVQAILAEGIEIDLDATYAAMFAYKSKNYALLGHDGKISITGAALKSRGLEPFQRRYIRDLVTLLLTGCAGDAAALLDRYTADIREHRLPISDFAKREVLSSPPRVYQEKLAAKKTRRSAAYELVLRSDRVYKQGDQVAFYVTGDKKTVAVTDAAKLLADAVPANRDENIPYYLAKLAKLHEKFAEACP